MRYLRRASPISAIRGFLLLAVAVVVLGPIPSAAATTGQITEFSTGITPASYPWGITAGPDGNLWFTESTTDQVGRITPSGTVTEFSKGISPNAGLGGITAGPDGNLWFAEGGTDKIGRITPSGTVTEFSTGITPGASPDEITTGPDGNLWFTEQGGNRIARITPSGTVKEFSKGISPNAELSGITAGPDGNLWFAENNTSAVGRITPSGTVTEFSDGSPVDITAGPDGNMWFADEFDAIGRITTSGTIHEFSSGITSPSNPYGIAPGPDGNLWFTEYYASQIGRITPSGTVTEFSTGITPHSNPRDIALGPDGNLWFVEYNVSKIGRIEAAVPGMRYALVRDYSFTPRTLSAAQGNEVRWSFLGPHRHSVADTSGMKLFHSGVRSFVSYYTFRFNAAGTYPYHCALRPTVMKGTVSVPDKVSPAMGGTSTTFHVRWSATNAPSGHVFDVQIKKPGTSSYVPFKTGVTSPTGSFVPNHGKGKYSFRSRLRKKSNGTHSGWSPPVTISAA